MDKLNHGFAASSGRSTPGSTRARIALAKSATGWTQASLSKLLIPRSSLLVSRSGKKISNRFGHKFSVPSIVIDSDET
jgi:hypothetical protein